MGHDRDIRGIADLGPGDHICTFYETEEEYRAVVPPFIRLGLERGERVIYLADLRAADSVVDALRGTGIQVEPFLERGQLTILTASSTYAPDGRFDPERMDRPAPGRDRAGVGPMGTRRCVPPAS